MLVLGVAFATGTAHAQSNDGDWVRLGDELVARGDLSSLERALDAYAHVETSGAQYVLALQRMAWVDFLLDRTTDAIPRYVALVDRLDAQNASGAVRDDALVMLAAMFADSDWDRDGTPDTSSVLERLADPALVPQDRAWLLELHFATARALYLSSRDPEAIVLLGYALARWPIPTDRTPIAAACRRHRVRPTTLHVEAPATRRAADTICARWVP